MANGETPSSVMYSILKGLKVSNKDAAGILLSPTQKYGEKLLRDRIEERTFLFRLTHGELGELPESCFADFALSAQALCSRIVRNDSAVEDMAGLAHYLEGEPLSEMAHSCKAEGADGALFANVVGNIAAHVGLSDADRASAIMLAFVVTGCVGDPVRATEQVEEFLRNVAARTFSTQMADESSYAESSESSDMRLGLVRVIDGGLDLNNVHELSLESEGTVIGSLATDAHSINEVGPLVSKRHLRIFRSEDGEWFVEGLGSTNGTKLISGADKSEVVVEAPKAERKKAQRTDRAIPVRLQPGDALHLAGTTVFLALKLA